MPNDTQTGADVNLKVAGQEIAVRNVKSLNTVATLATLVVAICTAVIGWQMFDAHAKDTKENQNAQVAALKDVAKSNRESSRETVKELRMLRCVMISEQKDRRRAEDDCERLFR